MIRGERAEAVVTVILDRPAAGRATPAAGAARRAAARFVAGEARPGS